MKLFSIKALLTLCMLSFSQLALADEAAEAIKTRVETLLGLKVSQVDKAPIEGMYQVVTDRGLFYMTADGQYLVQGNVYNLAKGMRNETEMASAGMRLEGLKALQGSTIDFLAKDEKYSITVFTDITCGYCRKLHNQIDKYNELGISVRYLAYPRTGPNTPASADLKSIWCATNPQRAMTDAKAGQPVKPRECPMDVDAHFSFGRQIGVTGTPAIILDNGMLLSGYRPPEAMLQMLKQMQ